MINFKIAIIIILAIFYKTSCISFHSLSKEVIINENQWTDKNFIFSDVSKELFKQKKWDQYDAFFLLTNDTELSSTETLAPMSKLLKDHKRVGILSPCSSKWGERLLLKETPTKYFWFIHTASSFAFCIHLSLQLYHYHLFLHNDL